MVQHSNFLFLLILALSGCPKVEKSITSQERGRAYLLVDHGTVLLRQGDINEAGIAFRVATEIGRLPEGFDGLACVAIARGDFDYAEDLLKMIVREFPEYYHAYGNLAALYDRRGDKSLAEYFYERALVYEPLNFKVRNNYAVFLREHNRIIDAELLLQEANILSSYDSTTSHNRKYLSLDQNGTDI